MGVSVCSTANMGNANSDPGTIVLRESTAALWDSRTGTTNRRRGPRLGGTVGSGWDWILAAHTTTFVAANMIPTTDRPFWELNCATYVPQGANASKCRGYGAAGCSYSGPSHRPAKRHDAIPLLLCHGILDYGLFCGLLLRLLQN